jgi:hypothetical protein
VKISNSPRPILIGLAVSLASLTLAGCHLYNNDNNETACAGYIGCSAHTKDSVGITPDQVPTDAGASDGGVRRLHAINTGCGKPLPANWQMTIPGKPTGYNHVTVQAKGVTLAGTIPMKAGPRTFWVRVPVDYNPNHKYRVQYIGQGCGGYEVANTSTVQFYDEKEGGTEQVIYVALDIPRDMANQDCYDNNSGPRSQEWEAFELFQTYVDSHFCVDNDRVYISGYSTGGWLTDMWGCYFAGDGLKPWNGVPQALPTSKSSSLEGIQLTSRVGSVGDGGATDAPASDAMSMPDASGKDVAVAMDGGGDGGDDAGMAPSGQRMFAPEYHIRGQLGISGSEPSNNPPCNGPLGAIWIHDLMDSNPYTGNHDVALPRVMKMNGCFSANPKTAPWHEEIMGKGVCVQYTDCPATYPVVFCTTVGKGHADQHGIAIPGYTQFLKEMETAAGLNKIAP